jgi:Uma2 family endonuclease
MNGVPPPRAGALPPLQHGERLDQKTFHARYEAMPPETRAELIGGVVYIMSSPLKRPHGRTHGTLMHWLVEYEYATPGVESFDNATNILGEASEPQPDACMLINVPGVGQTHEEEEYIVGAPELVAEVAASREAIDFREKRDDYERAGVKEYLVVALRQARVVWFVLRGGRFEELAPGPDGLLRSEVFPGLWLDPEALLRRDGLRLTAVLQQGLATPEHAAFVARLQGRG